MSLPKNSPYMMPDLVCIECGEPMRRGITKLKNGMLDAIIFYCDTPKCMYGFKLNAAYAMGTTQAVPYVPQPAPSPQTPNLPTPEPISPTATMDDETAVAMAILGERALSTDLAAEATVSFEEAFPNDTNN